MSQNTWVCKALPEYLQSGRAVSEIVCTRNVPIFAGPTNLQIWPSERWRDPRDVVSGRLNKMQEKHLRPLNPRDK